MPRSYLATAFTAAALVVLAGCSSSGDDAKGSSKAPAATSAATSAVTSAATSAASSAPSSQASGALQGALLAATDLGSGFEVKPSTSGADSPLPCTPDAKPLFTQFPPSQRVKQTYGNSGDTLEATETIAEYDATTAKQTFAAAVKGFACSSGSLSGQTVKIVKRPGSSSTADAESAAWDFTNGKILGTAAIIRLGTRLAAMTFAATPQTANDLNVNTVLQKAATKLAALG